MKNKKDKNTKGQAAGRESLSVVNNGDTVIIRTRSVIAAGLVGAVMLGLCIACVITLRGAWSLPWFWVHFGSVIVGIVYSTANIILSKIVLNSPKMTMTVYNPFKKEYKFTDINYVDEKATKAQSKQIVHTVTVYIGDGKRNVEISTESEKQACELVALMRGMLDNAAMEYPEGNEEPFGFDDDEKPGIFDFFKRLFEKQKKEESDPEKYTPIKRNSEDTPAAKQSEEESNVERSQDDTERTAEAATEKEPDDKGDCSVPEESAESTDGRDSDLSDGANSSPEKAEDDGSPDKEAKVSEQSDKEADTAPLA